MTFLDTHGYFLSKRSRKYDNGRDYISNELLHICSQSGIQIQHSVPHTPQQNGVAERKNRSLKEMTTCMLESKKLAEILCVEAMYAGYL